MQILIADYVGLNERMLRMGELINKMIKAIDALEENIERLDITWSGEANTQFMLAFYEDFNKMRTLVENMLNHKKLMRKMILEYQNTEDIATERIKEVRI